MESRMTEGRPLTLMLKFMVPLLFGNVFQQLYNMVDTIIVGRYVGPDALAAVGATGTIFFLIMGICNGMASGFTVLTSQKYGAGDDEGTRDSFTNGIMLSVILLVVMTVLTLSIMHPILTLMNTPANIYDDSYSYISTICMGLFSIVGFNLFSAFLRAIGNSRTPLIALICSATLNIILDLVFIVVFKMGVSGAAWATNISQAVSAIICIVYIYKKVAVLKPGIRNWRFKRECVRKQLGIGVPMALQFGITASGTMVMQTAVNQFGSMAVTGFTAAGKVQNLLTSGMMSIGQTCTAYAGQNFGKRDLERVHQGTKDAMKISLVYSVAAGAICIPLLPNLMQIFFESGVDITPYLEWARPYIYMCVVTYIGLCMIFVYRHTVQGCGYGFVSMLLGFMELAARLATAGLSMYLGSYYLAAAADPAAWASTGIFAFVLYLIVRKRMLNTQAAIRTDESEV
ncbi:MAG: MATE family efflux transporter [Eubacterium sp.]|nr:MATE family efflux transporter [Eubacterium sp.]